jgi:EmrB/QacA subfamily drug resistance transporter
VASSSHQSSGRTRTRSSAPFPVSNVAMYAAGSYRLVHVVKKMEIGIMSKDAVRAATPDAGFERRKGWLALIVLCLGVLMIMLDATIVYVALPSIRQDLRLTESSLVWVVNAYTLAFSGSLLLAGRLGDLYGCRKLFLIGIMMFTIASLGCGIANTEGLLVAGRTVQGVSGAVVVAVALSLIMNMFTKSAERAKAIGVYSFICAGGGSIGLLLGGMLTSALNWHWIFLVNLPVGVAVYTLCRSRLPNVRVEIVEGRLDVWGAVTMTTSLVLAIYAIVNGNEAGWGSARTLGLFACVVLLLAAFLMIEARVPKPMVPLATLRLRNLTISNTVCLLWAAGASASFFIALYIQLVLGYGPMQVGLAFLPGNVIMAVFALGLSARLVKRFGIRTPVGVGLLLGGIGLAMFARMPINGAIMTDVIPSMILIGLGTGIAFNPLLLAAMSDVALSESGLASGIVNTALLAGGALGLAIFASVCTARTDELLASGATIRVALIGGYRVAFLLGAVCTGTAALIGAAFLRTKIQVAASEHAIALAAAPAGGND